MEALLAFPIFSKVAFSLAILLASTQALDAGKYPFAITEFYDSVVHNVNNQIPNSPKKTSPAVSPVSEFTNYGFTLWDYLEDVHSDSDCVTHFNNLTSLCQTSNIQKVILFIPTPMAADGSVKLDFFQSNSSMPDNFISMTSTLVNTMKTVANVPNFEVCIFFENGFFNSDVSNTVPFVSPYTAIAAPLPASYHVGYFEYITNMLNWAAVMISQNIGISEVAFDPEGQGSDTLIATKSDQQRVYNYTDNYKWACALTYIDSKTSQTVPINLGTTIGIDESKIAFSNVSTFPVNPIFVASFDPGVFPNPQPFWRIITPELPILTVPLLQKVYIQAYQTNIPAIFAAGATPSGSHDGVLAATYFNKLLLDQPYVNGEGRISCVQGGVNVTGVGSNFLTFQDGDPFLFTTANPPKKIDVVDHVVNNSNLVLEDGSTITATNISWQRTEIAPGWTTQPAITQDMVNSIYWMFALNYEEVSPHPPATPYRFFGNWNLSDFMTFITNVNSINSANPPFTGLNFPVTNYVIYTSYLLMTTVNQIPIPPWDVYSE